MLHHRPATELSITPDRAVVEDRKRKRDVLSCLECRRRKLKCDRAYPVCSRCEKGGNANSCTYKNMQNNDGHGSEADESLRNGIDREKKQRIFGVMKDASLVSNRLPEEVSAPSTATLVSHENTIKRLESRLADLERVVARGSTTLDAEGRKEPRPKESETMFFKGRGFRTQFYGPSMATNQFVHFPEVRVFMKDIYLNSNLQRIQKEEKAPIARESSQKNGPAGQDSDLMSLIPERIRADHFVQLYFAMFEKTYRILHKPTFWTNYEAFWKDPPACKPGFVPILLLVMATVRCMSPEEKPSYKAGGSSGRREAVSWILSCDIWLGRQSQKHRTMEMYQVMCLRVLAASTNALKVKRHYTDVENLLTYCRAAGFHRDPGLLGDHCSAFDGEMRRRLWATVVELELQASLNRGAPSMMTAIPADCKPPRNIDDEDLTVDCTELPCSKPSGHYTATSYLRISAQNLPLRISLCSVINDPNSDLQRNDVLAYEERINQELAAIPLWTDPESEQASILLDLQLRQFLILLHAPLARRDGSQARYSRMICFETSKHILDQYSKLMASGDLSLVFLREDVFRAALSICQNAFLCTLSSNDFFFSGVMAEFSSMLDTVFKILEDRALRRGCGLHLYWYVSAACGLVETKRHPDRAAEMKLLATERVAVLYQKIMETWERETRPQKPDSQKAGQNTGAWYYSASVLGFADAIDPAPQVAPGVEYFDTSEWTLDNLWPIDDIYDSIA